MTKHEDIELLADEWVRERRDGGSDAWQRALTVADVSPDDAWRLLQRIVERADRTMHGPISLILETALRRYSSDLVERIEAEAGTNTEFQAMLSHVSIADDVGERAVRDRLSAASGGKLEIYPAPGSELGRLAFDVADLHRDGKLDCVPPGEQFPVPYIAAELERRLPGRSKQEYALAARKGMEWSR